MSLEPAACALRPFGQRISRDDPDGPVVASVPAGRDVQREQTPEPRIFIVRSGWAFAWKSLPDGGRQVLDVRLSGDCIGARGAGLPVTDHTVTAVTALSMDRYTPAAFLDALAGPRGMSLRRSLDRSEAIMTERLVGLGRRAADARTAHFFLELHHRLSAAGLALRDGFACPMRHGMIADALGLTTVHLSRVLRRLRVDGILTMQGSAVRILDRDAAVALADFDPRYLA